MKLHSINEKGSTSELAVHYVDDIILMDQIGNK